MPEPLEPTAATLDAGATPPRRGPALDIRPATLVGRYVVVQAIAQGGMGAVALAYDAKLARKVAIKVLLTATEPAEARARMVREAQAMAQLSHPNVVGIYDVGTHEGDIFLAMEFVDGVTMREWLGTPRTVREALGVMKQAGRGLAAAHAAGIVHRDFKPSNVLIGHDGRVRVVDFGIARATVDTRAGSNGPGPGASLPSEGSPPEAPPSQRLPETEARSGASWLLAPDPPSAATSAPSLTDPLTEAGELVGTIGYMAPEQVASDEVDARADVFAFAVTLWRAMFRSPPFPSASIPEYQAALVAGPSRPRDARHVPGWLEAVARRGLAFDPAARFQSMDAMLVALDADPRRRRQMVAAAALLVAAGASVVAYAASHRHGLHAACRAEGEVVRAAWSASRRDAVRATMLADGGPFAAERVERVLGALDRYADTWQAAQTSSCEETRVARTQPPSVHEDRSRCLLADRQALDNAGELLASNDPTARKHALAVTQALPPPKLCSARLSEAAGRLPSDPPARAKSLEARKETVRGAILSAAGKVADSITSLRRAQSLAREAGDPAIESEALGRLGRELDLDGKTEEATRALLDAVALGERGGDDHAVGIAAARVAFELGERKRSVDAARPWLELSRAALARIGDDPVLAAQIAYDEAELAWLEPEGAERAYSLWGEVIDKTRALYGESTGVCGALNNRSVAAWMRPDAASALQSLRDAIACEERVNGEHSQLLVFEYANAAEYLAALDRFDEALAAARRSTELLRAANPESPLLGLPIASEAMVLGLLGRFGEAQRAGLEALGFAERRAEDRPFALYVLGVARASLGDARGAKDACEDAVVKQEALEPPTAAMAYDYDLLRCAAESELALGDVESARAHLERSVTLKKRPFVGDLALARFALARALVSGGATDPARARDLADQAAAELRGAVAVRPSLAPALRAIEDWRNRR